MTPDDLKKFYKAEIDIERLFAADPDNQGVLQTAYWLCGCIRALLTREEALRSQAAVAAVHAHIAASKWDRWLDPRQDLTRVVEMLDKMAGVPARGASGEQSVVTPAAAFMSDEAAWGDKTRMVRPGEEQKGVIVPPADCDLCGMQKVEEACPASNDLCPIVETARVQIDDLKLPPEEEGK